MKNLTTIMILVICTLNLNAQDLFHAKQLTFNPEQEAFPTWSPDSKSIVYQYTNLKDTLGKNGLWKISIDRSESEQIFNTIAEHPKWSPDGSYIVFDAEMGQAIKMIPATGGTALEFLPDSIQIENGGLPCWSPDASQIAFIEGSTMSLCIYNIKTEKLIRIYQEDGMLPLPGCWSKDGKSILVALMNLESRISTITKISIDGKHQNNISGHQISFYRYLALSPDGSLIVYASLMGQFMGLYIMDSSGRASLPLAVTPLSHNEGPSWSPDGKKIAFSSTRSGNHDVWIMNLDIDQIKKQLNVFHK